MIMVRANELQATVLSYTHVVCGMRTDGVEHKA